MWRKVERQVLAPGSGVAELAFAFTDEVAAAASRDVFNGSVGTRHRLAEADAHQRHREKKRGGFGERSPAHL